MPATDLAATSFTGLGKLRIDFMEIWLIANYRAILINHYAATFLKPPYSHRHLSNLPVLIWMERQRVSIVYGASMWWAFVEAAKTHLISYCPWFIQSATRSPIMMVVQLVLARMQLGIMEASATFRFSSPFTLPY